MTIEEKLQHFYDVSVEKLPALASQALEEHKKIWRKCFLIINKPDNRMPRHRSKPKQKMQHGK